MADDNVHYLPVVDFPDLPDVPSCMDCDHFGLTNSSVGVCIALMELIDEDVARTCPDFKKGD